MKKFVKKLIVILIVAASVAVLYAAAAGIGYLVLKGSRPISDGELAARMGELVPAAAEINEIIWGKGLPVDPAADPPLESVTGAQYRLVAPDAAYLTLDELRAAIARVYSEPFIREHINFVVFDGDEGIIREMRPRYTQMRFTAPDGSSFDRLGVDITNKGFSLTAVIDPSSARFSHRAVEWDGLWWDSDRIVVTVSETYNGVTRDRELSMRLQDGVWMLDEATY